MEKDVRPLREVCDFSRGLTTQQSIVRKLDDLSAETRRLEALYQSKLDALAELK